MPLVPQPERRLRVMGVVNVTPDSFSDGGQFLDPGRAVAHGVEMAVEGADVLDVGGESTRPGADPVPEAEELRRVIPVVRRLVAETDVPVSVDTTKAAVALAALDAGATIVNDVSAGRNDSRMLAVVADSGARFVAMHMLGEPRTMQQAPRYDDVIGEVTAFLAARVAAAMDAGIGREQIIADPGIGFGKTADHNLMLLARLREIVDALPVPVLVGTSRKSFLARVGGAPDAAARDDATLATVTWAFDHGASMVRVHDVRRAVRAARLLESLMAAEPDMPAA